MSEAHHDHRIDSPDGTLILLHRGHRNDERKERGLLNRLGCVVTSPLLATWASDRPPNQLLCDKNSSTCFFGGHVKHEVVMGGSHFQLGRQTGGQKESLNATGCMAWGCA